MDRKIRTAGEPAAAIFLSFRFRKSGRLDAWRSCAASDDGAVNDAVIEDGIASKADRCGRRNERDGSVSGGGEGLPTNDQDHGAARVMLAFPRTSPPPRRASDCSPIATKKCRQAIHVACSLSCTHSRINSASRKLRVAEFPRIRGVGERGVLVTPARILGNSATFRSNAQLQSPASVGGVERGIQGGRLVSKPPSTGAGPGGVAKSVLLWCVPRSIALNCSTFIELDWKVTAPERWPNIAPPG